MLDFVIRIEIFKFFLKLEIKIKYKKMEKLESQTN